MPFEYDEPEVAAPSPAQPIIVEAPKLPAPRVNVEAPVVNVENNVQVMPAEVVVKVIKESLPAAWEEIRFVPDYYNDGRIRSLTAKRIK